MSTFLPFANDSQSITFPSGDDEMSLENGTDIIVLSGTLSISKSDPDSKANLQQLRDELDRMLSTFA